MRNANTELVAAPPVYPLGKPTEVPCLPGRRGMVEHMQPNAEVFERTIRTLNESFSDVAAQVREEVNRGRLVKSSDLSEADRTSREDRLSEKRLGRISKDEIAVVAYGNDEKVILLCEAVLSLAKTMTATRSVLLNMARIHGLSGMEIVFTEPDESDSESLRINLADELTTTKEALSKVSGYLQPVLQEVGHAAKP
jgi:hypothetical protein